MKRWIVSYSFKGRVDGDMEVEAETKQEAEDKARDSQVVGRLDFGAMEIDDQDFYAVEIEAKKEGV